MIAINLDTKRVYMKGDLGDCYARLKEMWKNGMPLIAYHFPVYVIGGQFVGLDPVDGRELYTCRYMMPQYDWTLEHSGDPGNFIRPGWTDE